MKKSRFSSVFSTFYGQHSITAFWATRSPWSIYFNFHWITVQLMECGNCGTKEEFEGFSIKLVFDRFWFWGFSLNTELLRYLFIRIGCIGYIKQAYASLKGFVITGSPILTWDLNRRFSMQWVCPTVRGDTFSPRIWDQGSLYPGFGPKRKKSKEGESPSTHVPFHSMKMGEKYIGSLGRILHPWVMPPYFDPTGRNM